jgi:hypothetical protein
MAKWGSGRGNNAKGGRRFAFPPYGVSESMRSAAKTKTTRAMPVAVKKVVSRRASRLR